MGIGRSGGAALAADRCRDRGVAVVAVGNSGHCGALGIYALNLAHAGLLGLVFSNGPAVMPPWGGHAPMLSTSPLAAGIPTRPQLTVVDLATSAAARGKIAQRAARSEPWPEGGAFAGDGTPTTDPLVALRGMLAPLGGAKGYALALLVEALTGGLVGPALAGEVTDMFDETEAGRPQRIAHLIVALDPRRLDSTAGADPDRLARLAGMVAQSGGRLPGARRRSVEELDPDTPLEVPDTVERELHVFADQLGVHV